MSKNDTQLNKPTTNQASIIDHLIGELNLLKQTNRIGHPVSYALFKDRVEMMVSDDLINPSTKRRFQNCLESLYQLILQNRYSFTQYCESISPHGK